MSKTRTKTIFEAVGRNPVHPFPARMAPDVALDAIDWVKGSGRVLDPMMGSGTVLAVARSAGHRAIGVDSDPLAVLIARVWTTTIDAEMVRKKATQVLGRARMLFKDLTSGRAYPHYADDETRRFIRYWFDDYSRRQLFALATVIGRVCDHQIRDTLWCAFSRLIITKQSGASLAMDLSHSRPHKKFAYAPTKPFNKFIDAAAFVSANCPQRNHEELGPPSMTELGDARNLVVDGGSIDLVVTSPPYLNAIDYLRCSKFSLIWMGYTIKELRGIRGEIVGSERGSIESIGNDWVQSIIERLHLRPHLGAREHRLLSQYIWDMDRAVGEVHRVLRNKGRAIYVVGDSKLRGTFVRNSEVISMLAENHGLSLISRNSRTLPANRRYLPPPEKRADLNSLDNRMRREVVLKFEKAAGWARE